MPLMDMVRSRERGVVIPGWQRGRLKAFRGQLLVRQVYQQHLHRYVLTATMHMTERNIPPPPPLWDVRVVELDVDHWVLTGFERITDGGTETDYAQSWVLMAPRPDLEGYNGSERI